MRVFRGVHVDHQAVLQLLRLGPPVAGRVLVRAAGRVAQGFVSARNVVGRCVRASGLK